MEVVFTHCAGLAVHNKTIIACSITPGTKTEDSRREFGTFSTKAADLLALFDWLESHKTTYVALKIEEDFWQPVYNLLKAKFEVLAVDSQLLKNLPGSASNRGAEWHGGAALFACVVIAYAGHLAFPLLRGVHKILPQMRTLTFWSTCLSFLAIASGNWAYMRYRADASMGGARAWLKAHSPLVHYLLMEYHEFSVLFTLPLGVACTWILWHYGDSILEKQNRPVLTATCLGLMGMMFFALGGLITGIGVAKVRAL